MTIRQRLAVTGLLAVPAVVIYIAARYYSPVLIAHVVERTLIEKSPPGTDPELVRVRFRTMMAASPTRQAKLERLLELSQYLEKVQNLTGPELERLLQDTQKGRHSQGS